MILGAHAFPQLRPLRGSASEKSASPQKLRSRRGSGHSRRRIRQRTNDMLLGAAFALAAVVILSVTFMWSYVFVRTLNSIESERQRRKVASNRIPDVPESAKGKESLLETFTQSALEAIDRRILESPNRKLDDGHDEISEQNTTKGLKLPAPIIVVGMPKSGTTSIHSYFSCGGRKSSHFACEADVNREAWRNCRIPNGAGGPASSAGEYPLCSVCVRRNIMRDRPPLDGCGDYEVWSELDSAEHPLPTMLANRERKRREREEKEREEAEKKMMDQVVQLEEEGGREDVTQEEAQDLAEAARVEEERETALLGNDYGEGVGNKEEDEEQDENASVRPLCLYPQITNLEEIHAAYPNATFILNLRPVENWIRSVSKWTGDLRRSEKGYLRQVLTRCDFPGLPAGKGDDDADLEAFYLGHSNRIREFVRQNPSHALLEVNIEDAGAGMVMENAFGISSECWTIRNASPPRMTPKIAGFGKSDRLESWKKRKGERIIERLEQRRREGNDRLDVLLRQKNEEMKRNGRDPWANGYRPVDLRAEIRERQRRRQKEARENLHGREADKQKIRIKDLRLRRDRGLMPVKDKRLSAKVRFARYPVCTHADNLFGSRWVSNKIDSAQING